MSEALVLRVRVEGEPVPKGRPRVVNRRAYTPPKTRRAERDVGWAFKSAMRGQAPVTGPVEVWMVFGRRARRGDLDNLIKLVLDSANGIVWVDDRQVRVLIARVEDAMVPATEIEVRHAS